MMKPITPVELLTAMEALYGHDKKTFELWEAEEGITSVCPASEFVDDMRL